MKERSRILHVAPMMQRPAGVAVYVGELLKALACRGDVTLGLLSGNPYQPLPGQAIPVVTYLRPPERPHHDPFNLDRSWIDHIEKSFGRPDLVHVHDLYEPFETALARLMERHGWPYVVSPHGGLQPYAQARKPLKKYIGNLLFSDHFIRHAVAVHALNVNERESVLKRFPDQKVFIMPNGVADDLFARPLERRLVNSDGIVFGFIGRIDLDNKGIDLLLEAVRLWQAKDERAMKARFVFAGPFHAPKDKALFEAYRNKLRFPDNVAYAGVVLGDAKAEMLGTFDVFLHTSRYEGMPGAVLEAMSRGVACLVTPGTNMQPIIRDNAAGWCCEANPVSIAVALGEAARAGSEISLCGDRARAVIGREFLWSKVAAQYLGSALSFIR